MWDDNYFFAALPSVPAQVEGDDAADSGRYIAGVVPVTDAGEIVLVSQYRAAKVGQLEPGKIV